MIHLKITGFEKGESVLVNEPNKMWDDDVVTTSSRISYEYDGIKCGAYVKADNVEDALDEIIPNIQLNQFFEDFYRFKDIGLDEPAYSTYDDGNGKFEYVDNFLNSRNSDIEIFDEEIVMSNLFEKASQMFPVEVVL